MRQWYTYIEELLYLHDCVIIPGFGGFIGNYTGARIDSRAGVITPPAKTVSFNKQLNQNDGLLVQWVAQRENIDYQQAYKRVMHFCNELKSMLNQQEKIAFGVIGCFYLTPRFHLVFEPGNYNFLPEVMGMEQLSLRPISPAFRDKPLVPYIQPENGFIGQLFKYVLSAAVITGIIIITQSDLFRSHSAAGTAVMQPAPKSEKLANIQPAIVSPECDFVDFDPLTIL